MIFNDLYTCSKVISKAKGCVKVKGESFQRKPAFFLTLSDNPYELPMTKLIETLL